MLGTVEPDIFLSNFSKHNVVVGSIDKFNNWDTALDPLDESPAQLILNRCSNQMKLLLDLVIRR